MKNDTHTFEIEVQPLSDGRLQVSIPEIGTSTIIESTRRDAAMDAAYSLIDAYLQQHHEAVTARKTARRS